MSFWYDGEGIWMWTPATTAKARLLRREPRCAMYIPPRSGSELTPATVVHGHARVYGLHDPVVLALHSPAIAAAMTALAAKEAPSILGYFQDATRAPARWLPHDRAVLRIRVAAVHGVESPLASGGVAPALPGLVPAEIRRRLAGGRRVVVASSAAGHPELQPAVWGAGFTVDLAGSSRPRPGTAVAVTALDDPGGRPTDVVGLRLSGSIEDGRLRPVRATWWHGFEVASADVPATPSGGFVMPD